MRYFLQISYCGTHYHGWQRQPNAITVQEVVEEKMSQILNTPISVMGCGRTDAGVHASAFYLHFETEKTIEDRFIVGLSKLLPKDIAVHQIIEVTEKAHARYDATYRAYDYFIHFEKNPFLDQYSTWLYWKEPDIERMKEAAKLLLQYKDFNSFCKTGGDNKTTLCDLYESELFFDPVQKRMRYRVAANRFLRGMVRRIVGMLILVGRGKLSLEEVKVGLDAADYFRMNLSAPPQGLFLTAVHYPYIKNHLTVNLPTSSISL